MPRRSSAGRSASRAAPRRAPTRRRNPVPRRNPAPRQAPASTSAPVNRSSRPAHREDDYVTRPRSRSRSPSSGPSILGTIAKAGIAYCVVRTLAHANDAMSPRPVPVAAETVSSATNATALSDDACGTPAKAFQDCVNANSNDVGKCQLLMDMLSECRKNSGSKLSGNIPAAHSTETPQVTN